MVIGHWLSLLLSAQSSKRDRKDKIDGKGARGTKSSKKAKELLLADGNQIDTKPEYTGLSGGNGTKVFFGQYIEGIELKCNGLSANSVNSINNKIYDVPQYAFGNSAHFFLTHTFARTGCRRDTSSGGAGAEESEGDWRTRRCCTTDFSVVGTPDNVIIRDHGDGAQSSISSCKGISLPECTLLRQCSNGVIRSINACRLQMLAMPTRED